MVGVQWAVGCSSILWRRLFLPWLPTGSGRMRVRSCGCISPLPGPILSLCGDGQSHGGQIGMRHRLTFACNAPDREFPGVKSSEFGSRSARVQNSANNCWVVLAVWASAESAKRGIFHQDMSSGPRGPHAVSKALNRNWRWLVSGRKWLAVA